jgi:hypothetical protein
MTASDLPSPSRARDMRLIGHSDQGGGHGRRTVYHGARGMSGREAAAFSGLVDRMGPAWSGREDLRRGRD